MKKSIFLLVICLLLNFVSSTIYSCTTFCIRNDGALVFGRNFDFSTGYGYVMINKRHATKTSPVAPPEKPLTWTSQYGSITFNQIGREFPYGGMNEAGLVVEQMWLAISKYPEADDRYGLSELQWIQYQLDNSATVNEVIASDTLVRVSFQSQAPLHFLVCDKQGDVATIEYIEGKFVYHKDDNLPFPVLTNNSYDESVDYVKRFIEFGGNEKFFKSSQSLDRFTQVAKMIKSIDQESSKNMIPYSFDILKSVSQGEATHWSIVYDVLNMKIHYKTYKNQQTRTIHIKDFDFSCQSPVRIIDIEKNIKNGKQDFIEYETILNRELIEKVFNSVEFLIPTPPENRDALSRYPESVICGEKEN